MCRFTGLWLETLPQLAAHIQTFPDAGHFVEERKFVEITQEILDEIKLH